MANFRALKHVIAVVADVLETLDNQLTQHKSRDRRVHIPPVELFHGDVAFFTASLSGPHSLSAVSSDGGLSVDGVLQKLAEALEVMVRKDEDKRKLLEHKKMLYTAVVRAIRERYVKVELLIQELQDMRLD